MRGFHRLFAVLISALLLSCSLASPSVAQPSLDDFWNGQAHFEQVGELVFGDRARGGAGESSSWFAVHDGIWYAFNRVTVRPSTPDCPRDHTRVVVRESRDGGRSWSSAATAVEPGASAHGDACAVLDGSTVYDPSTDVWHMLAQCLDRHNAGGWAICHYSRAGSSALGPFSPDPLNPVVRGGQLWSQICSGGGKGCPAGVVAEGTPDILPKVGGTYQITFHGFDRKSGEGFRGVARTSDFHHFQVAGGDLPGDASLGPRDCQSWFRGCVGIGEASIIESGKHRYAIAEVMDQSLLCRPNQQWAFALFQGPARSWPRSGDGSWHPFRSAPLLTRSWPDPNTPCAIAYARWLKDGPDIYLIYEDWEPKHAYLHRRLLKLVAGPPRPRRRLRSF